MFIWWRMMVMAETYATTVSRVADFYLSRESMTPKKLQKLIYYAYAWTLTLLNDDENHLETKLFPERIEAWVHGPVCPQMYYNFKEYGWNPIPQKTSVDIEQFSPDVLDVLEQVWDVYGGFNGNELESISHQEEPWLIARKGYNANQPSNEELDDKIIYHYYNQRVS